MQQQIKEGPISREEIKNYKSIDYRVFFYARERQMAQSDILETLLKNIEYLSPEQIFDNTIKTLEFTKHIDNDIQHITQTIEKLKDIQQTTGGSYGLQLELRIPHLDDRLEKLIEKIDKTYKASNTHLQLSNREKEIIQQQRIDIQHEIIKFTEDLREYL